MLLKFSLSITCCLIITISVCGQFPDSIPTGYLLDAAEEYWPAKSDSSHAVKFTDRIKHLPVNGSKGFNTTGINLRETYELFDNYFWGMGTQDRDGYFLHRILLHNDLRWNRYVRFFAEVQSSTISGRNGGPRPVQDRNDFAINQAFGELSFPVNRKFFLHARIGKQYLNYGSGTLLDARDANVRRSFLGYKLILENKSSRLDAFYMEPTVTMPGSFDDIKDHSQKIAGIWVTKKYNSNIYTKIDLYYLFIKRDPTKFNQAPGVEQRSTLGTGITLRKGNLMSFTEADLQWGRFNEGKILAWKLAPSIAWQFQTILFKPVLSLQGAISSGDRDAKTPELQTFNPLYPKAIFYGFIDNAGSANLIVVHPKVELQLTKQFRLSGGYYHFRRQHAGDGLYAVNGAFLLPASSGSKDVGTMLDLMAVYTISPQCVFQVMGSFYQRGKYFDQQPATHGDIRYLGIRTTVRI